jgi:hypothetical protein
MFDSIASLAVAQNMRELFRLVLVDTPLAPYFSDNLTHEDLDEMNIEIMRNTLYKAYLDDFAAFCQVSWALRRQDSVLSPQYRLRVESSQVCLWWGWLAPCCAAALCTPALQSACQSVPAHALPTLHVCTRHAEARCARRAWEGRLRRS